MNRLKTTTITTKSKPKLTMLSPSNKKSVSKLKQKIDKPSPRNRVQTIESKKSLDICAKKPKMNIIINENTGQKGAEIKQSLKGYETPKFKWQI